MTSALVPYLALVSALVALGAGLVLGVRAHAFDDRRADWPGLDVLLAGAGLLTSVAAYFLVIDGADTDEPNRALLTYAVAIIPVALVSLVGPRGRSPLLVSSYAAALTSAMLVAWFAFEPGPILAVGIDVDFQRRALVFPLAVAGFGAVGAVIGAWASGPGRPGRSVALSITGVGGLLAARTAFDGLDGVDRWWAFPLAAGLGIAAAWSSTLVTPEAPVALRALPVAAVVVALVAGWLLTADAVALDEVNRYGLGLAAVGATVGTVLGTALGRGDADGAGSWPAVLAGTLAAVVAVTVSVDLVLA